MSPLTLAMQNVETSLFLDIEEQVMKVEEPTDTATCTEPTDTDSASAGVTDRASQNKSPRCPNVITNKAKKVSHNHCYTEPHCCLKASKGGLLQSRECILPFLITEAHNTNRGVVLTISGRDLSFISLHFMVQNDYGF